MSPAGLGSCSSCTLGIGTRYQVSGVSHYAATDFGYMHQVRLAGKRQSKAALFSEVRLTGRIKGVSAYPYADGALVLSRCLGRVFCNTEYGFRKGS